MTQRSKFQMAALASAAMPGMVVSGVREAGQPRPADAANGISQATVQDAVGKLYDVYVTDTEAGCKALAARVHAADTLSQTRELGGLGFVLDRVVAFERGGNDRGPTAGAAVMITAHPTGTARPLSMLTIDDCTAMGTAIGAIHRLNGAFLAEHDYPTFTTGQIRAQLTAWIKRLRAAGHIPGEITASWARVLETEGLWSFTTCPVHGGFDDGDVLFSGSTITAITNWQDMQINDPARDLAWIFAKLDETHRNAVLAAYGRMLGNRLDDLIMLRANLWLQMEQVGDFVQALSQADNARILQFKAQVERLAHQLGVATQRAKAAAPASKPATGAKPPSTITVSTLLNDAERHGAASHAGGESPAPANADEADNTGEMDRTGSAQITTVGTADPDSTADRPVTPHSHPATSPTAVFGAPSDAIYVTESGDTGDTDEPDDTDDTSERTDAAAAQPSGESTATIVIPRLEREEQAMRDARAGIDGDDDNDDTDERTPQA